jgi:predicted DCC family thiol-disulfide oxidoreductase YuxK
VRQAAAKATLDSAFADHTHGALSGQPVLSSSMAERSPKQLQKCLLLYDGECRLCVTAKRGLERLETHRSADGVRLIAYQSEEAKQALGADYRPGRPDVALLLYPDGRVAGGLDAFLPLLPGLKGGRILAVLFKFPPVKPFAYVLYRFIARYRYRLFGEVPLEHRMDNLGPRP